jgi:putative endonuclease
MKRASVYILKCLDNSYYTGKTHDLDKRLDEHQTGKYKGYTFKRRPVQLVFAKEFYSMVDAITAKRQIKGWSRAKKEALINGNFNLLHQLAECKNDSHYKNSKGT